MTTDYSKVILPLIRRVMPNIIANDIIGVQNMMGEKDYRYDLTGVRHIDGLTFELYRGSEEAMIWLENSHVSYGLVREMVIDSHLTAKIFALKVRYQGGQPATPTTSPNHYEWGKVTFHDESDAVLFKLTFI